MKRTTIAVILTLAAIVVAALLAVGASSNNIFLGRVTASVGEHAVVVTDCYRLKVPLPERLADTARGEPAFRYAPCRDAVLELQGCELTVNGVAYGALEAGDTVTIDHGLVLINDRAAVPAQSRERATKDVPPPASN